MGLTIEIVTSIVLILRYVASSNRNQYHGLHFNKIIYCKKFILLTSVGLALDYAAHIGVTYVVTKGKNRRERAQASVSRFSSILPFSSTATSD